MGKLTSYMMMQFARSALGLLLAALFLVWITQALRLFDVITAKGQDLLTLAGQAFLTTPQLALEITALCAAVGIVRTFREMAVSRELHAIHAGKRTTAIWAAVSGFSLLAALFALIVSHWVEPTFKNSYEDWTERVAADLVSRTLEPKRFREVAPNFVVEIGGRDMDGTLTDFFADDSRDENLRRFYLARTANITSDGSGYYIQLFDGSLQFLRADGRYSEVLFDSYELALDKLAGAQIDETRGGALTTWEIIQSAADRDLTDSELRQINSRMNEGWRVLALCLFVAAMAGFPQSQRQRNWVPLEFIAIILTLGDQVLTRTLNIRFFGANTGPVCILALAIIVLAFQMWGHRLPRPHGATA